MRCLSEWILAKKKRHEAIYAKHLAVLAFNPRVPWDNVPREAADSQSFWYKELLEPALLYEKASWAFPVPIHRVYEADASSSSVAQQEFQRQRGNIVAKKKKGDGKDERKMVEYSFACNRAAKGCKEPCPNNRWHNCEGCNAVGVRSVNCKCGLGPLAKKPKGWQKSESAVKCRCSGSLRFGQSIGPSEAAAGFNLELRIRWCFFDTYDSFA